MMKFLVFCLLFLNVFNKSKPIAPPATILLKNNIYIDNELISQMSWQEFHFDKKGELNLFAKTLNRQKIDSLYGEVFFAKNTDSVADYLSWRTKMVNKRIENYKKDKDCKIKFLITYQKNNLRVKYRLPTKDELEYAYSKKIIKKTEYQEITQETANFSNFDKMKIAFRCVAEVIDLNN